MAGNREIEMSTGPLSRFPGILITQFPLHRCQIRIAVVHQNRSRTPYWWKVDIEHIGMHSMRWLQHGLTIEERKGAWTRAASPIARHGEEPNIEYVSTPFNHIPAVGTRVRHAGCAHFRCDDHDDHRKTSDAEHSTVFHCASAKRRLTSSQFTTFQNALM